MTTTIDQTLTAVAAETVTNDSFLEASSGWTAQSGPDPESRNQPLHVAIIDDRALMRDCLGKGLIASDSHLELTYFPDVESFEATASEQRPKIRVFLLCVLWSKTKSEALMSMISRLKAAEPAGDIIAVADIDDIDDVLKAIEHGLRGYIPTSDRLAVAVRAIQLVAAGGVYVPPSLVVRSGSLIKEMTQAPKQQPVEDGFTSRQLSVIEALRRGKANKVIAYELNMCESTVKVHIRNVMKKVKARNRTELAYIFNNKMQSDANRL